MSTIHKLCLFVFKESINHHMFLCRLNLSSFKMLEHFVSTETWCTVLYACHLSNYVLCTVYIHIKYKAAPMKNVQAPCSRRALCFQVLAMSRGHFYLACLMDRETQATDTLFIKRNSMWAAVCPNVVCATQLLITFNGV